MSRFQKLLHVEKSGCEAVELNVQLDHEYLLVKVPPKVLISTVMGKKREKLQFRLFKSFLICGQKDIGVTIFGRRVIVLIP